jgi:ADP-ribosylglycohydrolase
MIGSITGDIVGSIYELHNTKSVHFPLFNPRCTFTDDTVCTSGIASAILFRKQQSNKIVTYIKAKKQVFGETIPDLAFLSVTP